MMEYLSSNFTCNVYIIYLHTVTVIDCWIPWTPAKTEKTALWCQKRSNYIQGEIKKERNDPLYSPTIIKSSVVSFPSSLAGFWGFLSLHALVCIQKNFLWLQHNASKGTTVSYLIDVPDSYLQDILLIILALFPGRVGRARKWPKNKATAMNYQYRVVNLWYVLEGHPCTI